jgi:zinc protease
LIEFMKEINRLRDELVPEEEFEMYKTAVIQRLPRVFETPAQIASQLLSLELFNLPDNFFSTLLDNYQKVTREDIRRVAQKYMTPNNLTIVVVGDEKTIKDKINKLNLGDIILCDERGKVL